ncbi:MAG TPA: hypothetical protein VLV50_08345 [Stellaceae bacterium]|nr:hypothetical protein [Stellaceae bacterium]
MANASETYQGTLRAPGGLPRERVRLAAAIVAAALLVVAFVTIEPLRSGAIEAFRAFALFSAIVAG